MSHKLTPEGRAKHNEQMRNYRKKRLELDPDYLRRNNIKSKYGISLEEYQDMLDAQDGVCAGCGTDDPETKSGVFHVDHDHATNKIRGLLCHGCNLALGMTKDNPNTLVNLAAYLLRGDLEE